MRKLIYILVFLSTLFFPYVLNSQITCDSLTGTYAGEYWFKWEEDTAWTISKDTAFVVDINQYCAMTMTMLYFHPWIGGTWIGYETSYDFCFGNSFNWFYRFHSDDSLTIIYDDVSMPPPNYHVSSTRWFGTKISDSILVHVNETNPYIQQVKVFPNPVSDKLHVETIQNQNFKLQLFDMHGNELINCTVNGSGFKSINTQNLVPGIYFLRLHFKDSIQNFKVIKD